MWVGRWLRVVYSKLGSLVWGIMPIAVGGSAFIIGLNVFVRTIIARNVAFVVRFFLIIGAVAYFTLLERKLLGHFQLRVGPNKVGFIGLGQPIADAIKLFLKEFVVPDITNRLLFVMGPCLMLTICLGIWVLYPVRFMTVHYFWGYLLFVCASSCSIYGVVMCGWSSNSKYAYLGRVRAAAQFISYEVCIVMIVLAIIFVCGDFNFYAIGEVGFLRLGIFGPLFVIWIVTVLAETNRAPFDFVEGESELVSGFNVEYSGVCFAIIFIAEYRMVLFMRMITGAIYLGGVEMGVMFRCLITLLVAYFIVLCRGGLPRYRYDLLMGLTWKYFLPLVLRYLAVIVMMS